MAWLASMGFLLFGVGNGLAITGLVLAALGYAHGAVGGWIIALVAAGEITVLGSVLLRRTDRAKTTPVMAGRHRVGIGLLILHLVT
jgi:hypothetical protein